MAISKSTRIRFALRQEAFALLAAIRLNLQDGEIFECVKCSKKWTIYRNRQGIWPPVIECTNCKSYYNLADTPEITFSDFSGRTQIRNLSLLHREEFVPMRIDSETGMLLPQLDLELLRTEEMKRFRELHHDRDLPDDSLDIVRKNAFQGME